MMIDFAADVRITYLDHLKANSDPDIHALLDAMKLFDLLACYLNWSNRLIRRQTRTVLESTEFTARKQSTPYATEIMGLIFKIESGGDLQPHLSRRVTKVYIESDQRRPLTKYPHLDLLLNQWGIHHLHISNEMEPDGFVKRGSELVFAIFLDDRAYLLDVLGHDDFANDDLVRIIVNNWPNDGLFAKLNCLLPGVPPTASEIQHARSKGFDMFVNIDGQAYMSRHTGGLVRAGTSARNTHEAILAVRRVREAEEAFSDPHFVQDLYGRLGLSVPILPDLHLDHVGDGWAVVDRRLGLSLGRIQL